MLCHIVVLSYFKQFIIIINHKSYISYLILCCAILNYITPNHIIIIELSHSLSHSHILVIVRVIAFILITIISSNHIK